MKRCLITAAALLLLTPFDAWADILGTGQLTITASLPNISGYYGDYDASNYARTSGMTIEFSDLDVFCISQETITSGSTHEFGFYAASEKLGANTALITWIANWANVESDNDTDKGFAQGAIWQSLGVITGNDYLDVFTNASNNGLYDSAANQNAFVNQWLVAVNPTTPTTGSPFRYGWCARLFGQSRPRPRTRHDAAVRHRSCRTRRDCPQAEKELKRHRRTADK